MAVSLREAQVEDRGLLETHLAEYLFEFDGQTAPYPYLDGYWDEAERLPLLIEIDDEVVGFSLVRRRRDGWSIAEFSITPGHRRNGVGAAAVEELAVLARQERATCLEARVLPDNEGGLAFWLAVGFNHSESSETGVSVTRRPL